VDFGIILTRKVAYQVYIFAAGIMFNVALNAVFVPKFGYMAAAYATLASYVAVAVVVYVVSNRLYPLPIDVRRIAIVIASGTAVMWAGSEATALNVVQAIAVKIGLLAALVIFWAFFVLTDRERFRLYPTQLLRAH
jgi:O-antigen/teichoic acid export membrane protein